MTTNEEVALALREIKEAKIIPSYIEEPMGIEGVTVNTDEMFDLVINALKEKTCENCSFREHQEVCITCSRNYSDQYYDGEVAFPEENDNRH